jgi:hypothetical protein
MFKFLRKKNKDIKNYRDTWSVKTGILDGKPIFFRFREELKDLLNYKQYPFQVGVAVPLKNPTEDGLIVDTENYELNRIEDLLKENLCADDSVVFVMAITHKGMREFVYYAKKWEPEILEKKVKSVNYNSYKLQFIMQHDPKWDILKPFSK